MKEVFHVTAENAAEALKAYIKSGDVLLVKASRGMHLEDIVEKIMEWK